MLLTEDGALGDCNNKFVVDIYVDYNWYFNYGLEMFKNTKKKIMKIFCNLDKTKRDFDIVEKQIKQKEECLRKANSIKDRLECELQADRKRCTKLKETLKIFMS